jgi:thioredoxin reductase (NADPH)
MPTPSDLAAAQVYDTLIVGGGPGGLTAAIYLRRFTRNVALVDKGNSRLRLIPVSHNYPGFPEGVPGHILLGNLATQLQRYGGCVMAGEVTDLRIEDGLFVAAYLPEGEDDGVTIRAHTVVLATGVADGGLPIENWREAVAFGSVRLCPVCDGFDVIDKRIAVATADINPVGHALFMRTFSADVTLFERGSPSMLTIEDRRRLDAAGVRTVDSPLLSVTLDASMKPVLHTTTKRTCSIRCWARTRDRTSRPSWARARRSATRSSWTSTSRRRCPACMRSATWSWA